MGDDWPPPFVLPGGVLVPPSQLSTGVPVGVSFIQGVRAAPVPEGAPPEPYVVGRSPPHPPYDTSGITVSATLVELEFSEASMTDMVK